MNLPTEVERAFASLKNAIDHLEAALHRRGQSEAVRANLQEELMILQDDRSRLAVDLDGARARGKTLSLAAQEVAARLDHAKSIVKAVLSHAGNA